ncbi:hypothetical protein GOZ78_22470 [Agrobacterium vitis]|uniref:Response regulator n=1 Tax=Agrobacterium vitis TaxID=373 RepID=A0ABD6GEU8_AGRVI|nr:hypothetical protein [Agrobacterium vitis]MUO81705.1 hypothetical protein [Agrobacterium vitis]MUO96742.1 hypothetical protein [Agrobacterium vitis]MUP07431.1 hypothetical protein [Agrobacterium vitis]MUZ85163.1 hypothetical protein [Agrobacterium vitis]MVA12769.1 hypothetical protein [Agrobacterium vitis]
MTEKPLHVLVAEKQALIAIEIEVVLTEVAGGKITVCLPRDMPLRLSEARYDVVLIDATIMPEQNRTRFDLIRSHNAGVVFLTSFDEVPGFSQPEPGFALLTKPFDEQRLLAAVFEAAANRDPMGAGLETKIEGNGADQGPNR